MGECVGPSGDYLVAAEGSGFATLVGAVEDAVVDEFALIVHFHAAGVGGNLALTLGDYLIVYTVVQFLDAFLLGNLGHVFLTGLLVVTIDLFHVLALYDLHLGLCHLSGFLGGHEAVLLQRTCHESGHEVLVADGLGAVLAEQFVIDALLHLQYLLANLHTGIVGCGLLVIAGAGTVVQALYKLVDIGRVHTHALYQVLLQALCLCHTNGIAQGVYIILHVGLGSAVSAGRHQGCQSGSKDKTKLLHCNFLFR